MTTQFDRHGFEADSSDRPLLDLIRRRGPLTVAEMAAELGVTATAVRNRLIRLCGAGLVERRAEHVGRGRPRHVYQASVEAHRRLGQNYADLAVALWEELMRNVEDRKLRRILFARITDRLADLYRAEVRGRGWQERLEQLGTVLHGRGVETEVAQRGDAMPVLELHSCPYFELAEADRDICALERKMFEKVLGQGLRLSQCRLDGHRSCDFEAKPTPTPPQTPTPTPTPDPSRAQAS
ncbi:MarR family transcriptional regulator [Tautonia sp. JC769]|uniref:helix-turn-helix transcriptional regulator n=1 Tax=Tautonia sp. JC769 TaxID=3232135 RepID=UPI0034574A27